MMQIKGLGERMNIHIVCPEKGISACCNEYSVNEENIRKINEIEKGEAAPGEEILVLMPTRSYRTAYGDTIERIAMRFGKYLVTACLHEIYLIVFWCEFVSLYVTLVG